MRDELGTDARAFLDEASGGHDPSREDRERVAKALAASLGPAALGGVASYLLPKSAAASKGLFASLGAKIAMTAIAGTAVVGAALVVAPGPPPNGRAAESAVSERVSGARERAVPEAVPSPRAPRAPQALETAQAIEPQTTTPSAQVAQTARVTQTAQADAVTNAAADTQERPRRLRAVLSNVQPAAQGNEPRASSLARELELLQGARGALRDGDAARALSLLDEHRRTFASSSMGVEARMLRIDAFCTLGRVGEARGEARTLVSSDGSPAVVSRVRRSCVGDDFGTEDAPREH
jgi:hypothetical protein